jgi:hypothetical protein
LDIKRAIRRKEDETEVGWRLRDIIDNTNYISQLGRANALKSLSTF